MEDSAHKLGNSNNEQGIVLTEKERPHHVLQLQMGISSIKDLLQHIQNISSTIQNQDNNIYVDGKIKRKKFFFYRDECEFLTQDQQHWETNAAAGGSMWETSWEDVQSFSLQRNWWEPEKEKKTDARLSPGKKSDTKGQMHVCPSLLTVVMRKLHLSEKYSVHLINFTVKVYTVQ